MSEKLRDANLWIFAGFVLLVLTGLGSSALLQAFGIFETSETEISQSVLVDGKSLNSDTPPVSLFSSKGDRRNLMAGSTIMGAANITNRAETIAPIDMVTKEDGNYKYNMKDVRYDYILVEKYENTANSTETAFEVQVINNGYLAEGSYSVSSRTDIFSLSPQSMQVSGVNFHLNKNESKSVDPFSDSFMSINYSAGEEHTYPESGLGEKPPPGVIRLSVTNTSLTFDGEIYNSFEIFFDPEDSFSGNFSFDISQSYVYSDGEYLTDVNDSIESFISVVTVEEVSVLSGSVEDDTGSYHLIYDDVSFLGEDLIRNRMEVPDSSGDVNRVILQSESDYVFAASLRSAVFADPERVSHYKLQTSLEVPN